MENEDIETLRNRFRKLKIDKSKYKELLKKENKHSRTYRYFSVFTIILGLITLTFVSRDLGNFIGVVYVPFFFIYINLIHSQGNQHEVILKKTEDDIYEVLLLIKSKGDLLDEERAVLSDFYRESVQHH